MSVQQKYRHYLMALAVALLVAACGGSGGGSSGTVQTPPAASDPTPGGPTDGPPVAFADAEQIVAIITGVEIGADGVPVVNFSVANGNNTALVDVTADNVRFIIAKLQTRSIGNLQGYWQSYVNTIEQPGVGPGTEAKLHATAERGSAGTFTNNGGGTYSYAFAQAITSADDFAPAVLAQAALEGLDLSYDPDLTHRVSIQFDGGRMPANPSYDFQPSSGAVDQILRGLIVATDTCNTCHEQLTFHGGGRSEMDYCVTCHNPGTTDANSGNTMAFDELIHKIHYGANLPSVMAGEPYVIYGFRDSVHDYSNVNYPQRPANCTSCHAGSATDDGHAVATSNGDNWNEYPTISACGSCHDDLDFRTHFGGQPDDTGCQSCHAFGGVAGSPRQSHADLVRLAGDAYRFDILDVANAGPGDAPVVDFQVVDPTNADAPYDILSDAPFTQGGGASRLAVTVGWSTGDYTNTGNGSEEANTVSIDALVDATNLGDGVFRVTSPVAIPDGSLAPFVAATGSGAVTIEGHPAEVIDGVVERIAVTNSLVGFSIDEANGTAMPRRQVTELALCNNCHSRLVFHGENRAENLEGCATCHNARNSDRGVRDVAVAAPTDGKDEESIDFKTMVHGIHAAAIRENPLQIVGFRGFFTAVYDKEEVQYPGRLANCLGCHLDGTYTLPLAASVLGTTVDAGADVEDPTDDVVVSPMTAVCASCHDTTVAAAHMENYGGDFATTQQFLDNGTTVEQCATCHREGASAAVSFVHGVTGQ